MIPSHQLDPTGIGAGAEVVCYQGLKPGKRVLLWYPDDNVWHENLIALIVGGEQAVIYTPDQDLYIECLGCKGVDGPSRLRGLDARLRVPRHLRSYKFRFAITDDIIRQVITDAIKVVKEETGLDAAIPPVVTNATGMDVGLDAFFGGSPPTSGAVPGSPVHARPVTNALADYVWVSAEPLGGLTLGQEVSLNAATDVQVGDRTAMALRSGDWVKCEMIRIVDAADYRDKRRALFSGSVVSGSGECPPVLDRLKQAAAIDKAKIEEDDVGDVRTLWIDYDEHGERYKRWRDVCKESHSPTLGDKPLEGPATALHTMKHMERHGGDPRMWLQMWMRTKHISPTDRVAHEMRVLVDTLYFAGTYDQVNIPALMSLECVCRRMQAIVDAYADPSKPSWENAKLFSGQGTPEDLVSPTFRSYATKKNRDELELLQARQKVRELRGGHAAAVDDAVGDAIDALPPKAKAAPKSRGKAGKGQADA